MSTQDVTETVCNLQYYRPLRWGLTPDYQCLVALSRLREEHLRKEHLNSDLFKNKYYM